MVASEVKEGNLLKFDGHIFKVTERNMAGTGKFGKTVQMKLKNLETGDLTERRLRAEEKVEEARLERHEMEFLYREGNEYVFMDSATFEQFPMTEKIVGPVAPFLKENTKIAVDFSEGKPIHLDFPSEVEIKVASAAPGTREGTNATWKEVELENKVIILAPQFIKSGDSIRVDVYRRRYLERVKQP